ncbi:hypothetical protein HRS9122_06615 [Pyrenophora teres f. teres]|nr:hypothetical protein HRS9122_06615 [Pyrenophora teres f. teres]
MANPGLRGHAFYPALAPDSITAVFNTFENHSRLFGARGARNCFFPAAPTYLYRIATSQPLSPYVSSLHRMQRLGPVWAVPFNFFTSATQEFDYILLAKKIIENPDFPVVASWHQEFATLQPWYDIALGLSEDRSGDIFTHEVILKKVFPDFNKPMEAPCEGKLRMIRQNAGNDTRKMMQVEAAAVVLEESHRLLQVKSEELIPKVAKTDEQLKALRMIELKSLDIAKILDSSNEDVAAVPQVEMKKYSDDKPDDHFDDAPARESLFSKRSRNVVESWLFSVEKSIFCHVDLLNDDQNNCGPLKPVGEADDMIETVTVKTWPHGGEWKMYSCSFEFPCNPAGTIVLGLGCLPDQKCSEGHFTDIISAASVSMLVPILAPSKQRATKRST